MHSSLTYRHPSLPSQVPGKLSWLSTSIHSGSLQCPHSSTLPPAQLHATIHTAGSVLPPSPLPASHCSPSPRTLPPSCHPSLLTLVSPIAATAIQPICITKRRILCRAAEKPWLYNVRRSEKGRLLTPLGKGPAFDNKHSQVSSSSLISLLAV